MKHLKITLTALLLAGYSLTAQAEKQMTVGTWLGPSHTMNENFFAQWSKQISDATNGDVTLKLEYHKGHPKEVFDLVEDGTYDAGWSFHGYIPGRFKLTVMAELPLLGAGAQAASTAYWETYEKHLAKANEHDGLKLAALFMHGPGQIQMRQPISNLADMKGKKIRVGGGVQGLIGKNMGIAAIAAPGSKVYEILSQGVADGVFMPVGEQNSLRLSEVTKHIYEVPGGMYLGSFAIFLSPDFLASLDAKTRKALLKTTGKDLSTLAGKLWEENDDNGYVAAKKAGVEVKTLSDADVQTFVGYSKQIEADWLKDVAGRNVDAKKALADFRKRARAYQKKMQK